MKYAILSDIHANLPALEAVLADAKTCGFEAFMCLGDVVGGGEHPSECVDRVRNMAACCIQGEYDNYCAQCCTPRGLESHSKWPDIKRDIEWTYNKLSEEDRNWLSELPRISKIDDFTLVHGTLNEPWAGWDFNSRDVMGSFARQTTWLCFFGKVHYPMGFAMEQTESGQPIIKGGTYQRIQLKRELKYHVSPGSVSQSRDTDPRAAYALYDTKTASIELRRVDYSAPVTGSHIGIE